MNVQIGTEVPTLERTPDAVDLFTFSAAAWLLHRIHYDVPFTTEHDGHPGLLVHGPLQGTYMIQAVQWWLGRSAEVQTVSYRHSNPAFLGDVLECGGTVTEVDEEQGTFVAELWVRKIDPSPDGGSSAKKDRVETVTTSGVATFRLPSSTR